MNYKSKKIMILGDNPESCVLVDAANEMGLQTIVVGINKGTITKKRAWKSFDVNALDVDSLEKIAKDEQIEGISIGVADILVPAYTELCKRLGFYCYSSIEAVKYLSNKSLFKEQLKKVGLPVIPEFDKLECKGIEFPVVVKPVDSGGGLGISIVERPTELQFAIEYATRSSHTGTIQVEKYMTGDVVACYFTIIDGNVFLSSLEDNLFTKKQGNLCPVTTGHRYASSYIKTYFEKYHSKISSLLANVNARNGVLQINAFVEDGIFYFYDPGYRLQGEAQHHILDAVNGFDHKKMLIDFALTGKMYDGDFKSINDPNLHGKKCASVWILLKQGLIADIEGLDDILADKRVIFNGQRFFVGDSVSQSFIGTEKQVFSRIYIVADSLEELNEMIDIISQKLRIKDIFGNDMVLDMLRPLDV